MSKRKRSLEVVLVPNTLVGVSLETLRREADDLSPWGKPRARFGAERQQPAVSLKVIQLLAVVLQVRS